VPRAPTRNRKQRRITVAVAAAVLLASLGTACTEPPSGESPRAQIPEVSTPEIKQAKWRIGMKPVGAVAKVKRADKKRLKSQRPRLATLVKDVYDTLFLFPSRKRAVLRKHFTRRAARRVLSSEAGVSPRAERVRTWSRRADIGVQPNNAAAAAVKVYVRAKGIVGRKVFRLVHRATLWLQRSKRGWKVVGFEVEQGPAKKAARKDKEKHQKKRQRKRSPKKRRRNA
jgi:hypothetical protein